MARRKQAEDNSPKLTTEQQTGTEAPKKAKQSRISQSDCPIHTLEEVLIIPTSIKEQYAGQATDPMLVATACGYSPASSTWRSLTGAAIAYGLTEGGYNSKTIALTSLGERTVAPLIEGDEAVARRQASLIPTVLNSFFKQYDRNKFPREDIAKNVLTSKNIPRERVDNVFRIIKANGLFTNTIQVLSGGEYIRLSEDGNNANGAAVGSLPPAPFVENCSDNVTIPSELAERMNLNPPSPPSPIPKLEVMSIPKVFISHGKNSSVILGQLKELLGYGQWEPVISVEKEATAISVPEKVFDDMRSCDAGIIHICAEPLLDESDRPLSKLNENVLIEIGAAMALYRKRIIILCKKGTQLPSNLQGLYRCEYESDQLDYSATMKLLKTLQELRKLM